MAAGKAQVVQKGQRMHKKLAEFDLRTKYMEKGSLPSFMPMKADMQKVMLCVEDGKHFLLFFLFFLSFPSLPFFPFFLPSSLRPSLPPFLSLFFFFFLVTFFL